MDNDELIKHDGLIMDIIINKFKIKPGTPLFDECLSEARLALVRSLKTYDPSRNYKYTTYAGKSVYNAIIYIIRKYIPACEIIDDVQEDFYIPFEENKVLSEQVSNLIYECINELPANFSYIILMRMAGYGLKNIASSINISYDAAKLIYHSAIITLKRLMLIKDNGELEGVAY